MSDSSIISYSELVAREAENLQRGMNYRTGKHPSVFLMSTRRGAPYKDSWDEEAGELLYEGHDITARETTGSKKSLDQPMFLVSGKLTDNGKFFKAAQDYRLGRRRPLSVRVYEKLDSGVWFDKGLFELVDATFMRDEDRNVFRFSLRVQEEKKKLSESDVYYRHERAIPSRVKVIVWNRDKGRCTKCVEKDGLHYDHIIPFSKGGRSDDERNIQLLCARHNLQKSDRIE